MTLLSLEKPVFSSFAIAAALMILKLMGQGWMTVFRMIKSDAGLINPEDLRQTPFNASPRPEQLYHNDYVDRSRRMQRNDLESIPAFWAVGLLFVLTSPPLWAANLFFFGFVLARLAHSWAYATQQNHETRAAFFSVGSIIVIVMALWVLIAAVA